MSVNIYGIRQALLRELKEQRGAPMRFGDVLAVSAEPALAYPVRDLVLGEWENLRLFGYIEPIAGFGGEYCRLAEKGLRQLSPEFPQDVYIWGPGAK